MSRIFVQGIATEAHPSHGADGYRAMNDGIARAYRKVLRPDTVVDMGFVARTTHMTNHSSLALLNTAEVLRGVVHADEAGYDAVFVRCGNDPGIDEARESVNLPVVGMAETAMLHACTLGSRFAVRGDRGR